MQSDDRAALKDQVRALLREHVGPENCITMTQLFHHATGEPVIPNRRYDQSRIVRSLVEELRRDGCPIGLHGGINGGYFWARSADELDPTVQWFHRRALSSLKQEAALKRVPFEELLKQYQLEFHNEEATSHEHAHS